METAAAIASALTAIVGVSLAWLAERRTQLRREEVLGWANEAIAALETLLLLCLDEISGRRAAPPPMLEEIRFSTAILVERGRLFFRNAHPNRYGKEKQPAYRGYRPCVLDDLVIAHQIASAWPAADAAERLKMRLVAEDCLKRFVSLIQKEVGRSRTASADTSRGGRGARVGDLTADLDPTRVRKAAKLVGLSLGQEAGAAPSGSPTARPRPAGG